MTLWYVGGQPSNFQGNNDIQEREGDFSVPRWMHVSATAKQKVDSFLYKTTIVYFSCHLYYYLHTYNECVAYVPR